MSAPILRVVSESRARVPAWFILLFFSPHAREVDLVNRGVLYACLFEGIEAYIHVLCSGEEL